MDSIAFVTRYDAKRLCLFFRSTSGLEASAKRVAETLNDKLRRAIQLPPQAIPENVVTLDSRFHIVDQSTKEVHTYTLVMPEQADILEGRLSILSPLGACVYGHVSGDRVELCTPGGIQRLAIGSILYQPEAFGLDLM